MEVTLEPKTRKGENTLANVRMRTLEPWDGTWEVLETRDFVQFAAGQRGPWHLLTPRCKVDTGVLWRWVHGTDDANFNMRPNP